ncbi:MAG TPA: hypothetical protein VNW53_12895 [Phenylobacterium sp.]|uniref:hypothetical protein n=1 Tax=Phenylobacterium sp. TaxID=1871053 RepID=UPI002B805121|nr:hypothetical protein [Phenylobacterium sp.]HXA39892.1 hypothetical protein [Phenylobacterium sp.]
MDPLSDAPGPTTADLARENLYLRQRVAQLTDDVASLAAEGDRLRQILERMHGRVAARRPDPLSGGQ